MSEQPSSPSAGSQPSAARRRKARTLVLQALYQWHMTQAGINQIEAEFAADNDMAKVDVTYFRELLRGIPAKRTELDNLFAPLLDRPVSDVDPIELALLRMGAYELANRIDVPYRVVINEAVELAKKFGGTDGHKYVNGILDKLAPRLRQAETRRYKGK